MGIETEIISMGLEEIDTENHTEKFGLELVNDDSRRSIYTIVDADKFLDTIAPKFGADVFNKTRKYFDKFPDGLRQFFKIKKPEAGKKLILGNHYHTPVEAGGAGKEIFIFASVPLNTNIKLHEYQLGKSKGKIRYGIRSGAVMDNNPFQYHIIETDGSFYMVEIFEDEFKPEDLREFKPEDWGEEEKRLVKGA